MSKPVMRTDVKNKVFSKTPLGRIKQLILAGKLTDDEIWSTVKKEFNIKSSLTRDYVNWGRHHLKVTGHKVPKRVTEESRAAAKKRASKKTATKSTTKKTTKKTSATKRSATTKKTKTNATT